MARQHPVGKAQQVILDALSLEATSFQEAEQVFADHGLVVVPTRQGRRSVPRVHLADTTVGGFNIYGEGETASAVFTSVDLDTIKEWMAK